MNPMQRIVFSICAILALVASFAPRASGAAPARTYVVTDLGSLGGYRSAASDINDFGHVVGWSGTSSGTVHAFLWVPGSGMRDLGTLGGSKSEARRISHDGLVAGGSYDSSGAWRPFLWDAGGGMRDLGTLGGSTGEAIGINVAGDAAGWSLTATGVERATLWGSDGMQDLGSLGAGSSASHAYDINTSGYVVGKARTDPAGQYEHAFIWSASGGMQDLGTLGGTTSGASAINKYGQVVGASYTAGGAQRAFVWSAGGMQDLGTLSGAASAASDINNAGHVVGSSSTAAGVEHAFLYSDGVMADLNTMVLDAAGWTLVAAAAINDKGHIVGSGLYNGVGRAFLLTPAPNQFPVASAGGPYTVFEGASVSLSASGSDSDGGPLTYTWDLDDNGTFETTGQTTTYSAASRDGLVQQSVAVKVCDDQRACTTAKTTVSIDNAAPVVGPISVTSQRSKGKLTVWVNASFADAGTLDTHTATWNWGDGTSSTVSLPLGTKTVSSSHSYPDSESYTITLSVTDDDGGAGQSTVVVGGRTRK